MSIAICLLLCIELSALKGLSVQAAAPAKVAAYLSARLLSVNS